MLTGNRSLSGGILCGCSSVLVPLAVCCKVIITDANLKCLAQDLERKFIHLANTTSRKSCCRVTKTATLRQISYLLDTNCLHEHFLNMYSSANSFLFYSILSLNGLLVFFVEV